MGLFNKKKSDDVPGRVIAGDGMDLDPLTNYDNIGWKMMSDMQDYDSLHNEIRHNAIARRIVYKPAEDATRNNFRVIIANDPERQKMYQRQHEDLKTSQVLCQQIVNQRCDGDGYMTIGVKERQATDTSTPLDPDNIEQVVFLHAFGQKHIDRMLTNDDPLSNDYGKEQAIVLRPQNAGYTIDKDGNQIPNQPDLKPRVIDQSRYWHITLDKSVDDETGTSILTRCHDQLKAMDIALESTGRMLREFTFKFYKSDQLMAEGDEDFKRDKREISQVLNTEAMAFGHSQDSIEKIATPTGGIDLLYNFVWQQLSAATGIPKSVLTGEQAGTLAGASQDVINYYDGIKAIQNNLLKPEIEQITRLLMYANGDDPDELDWKIVFNPLQSTDGKTDSEILLNKANAYSSLINSAVLDPDTVKQLFEGQDNDPNPDIQMTGDSLDLSDKQSIISHYKNDKKKAESHDDS